ncbi:sensor histidine kinase [Clostridium oryzae]|uniref:histidine kinase n=1 Tax=Clostridium oryzae TaxID=1450648 RepID=A0A1V4IXV6_9CLOT|nr:HAMP domain-containing sensor histidine kinase [Clostridium oryzae]OPJ64217.1 alkaline phosphatase synthesis sensor protein PhoR [Clostridium oryzae]
MGVKKISIQAYITRFVVKIGLAVVMFLLVSIVAFTQLMKMGILLPSNYSEQLIKKAETKISEAHKVTANLIPNNLSYVVLKKQNLNVVSGNMKKAEIQKVKKIISNDGIRMARYSGFYVIKRANEYCIIKYYIAVQFSNTELRRFLPYPEGAFAILYILCLIGILYMFTKQFSAKMKQELDKFRFVTERIEKQELDFKEQSVSVLEYQRVMDSLNSLRISLKNSLEVQFEQEKNKREQISALVHDIKIPITIIRGNAELLSLTQKDETSFVYSSEIMDATKQVEEYVKLLMETTNDNDNFVLQLEESSFKDFLATIEKKAIAAIGSKNIKIVLENTLKEQLSWKIDSNLMERAFMNIIMNGIEHTPEGKKISLRVVSEGDWLSFIVTDEGDGFSEEAMLKAKEMFYTKDKSRSRTGHYGIGLAFANKIIKAHGGKIVIENDEALGSGKVTIRLPLIR